MAEWNPPFDPVFGNDCGVCYPPGETPQIFQVNFSGIKMGDHWVPADGPPPNGTHFLVQTAATPCLFDLGVPFWPYLGYRIAPTPSALVYYVSDKVIAFSDQRSEYGKRFFSNSLIVAAVEHFYGGEAHVLPPWEVEDPVEDITPIVDPDPLFRFVPMPGRRAVVSYIDEWGDTKIKLLVDYTLR